MNIEEYNELRKQMIENIDCTWRLFQEDRAKEQNNIVKQERLIREKFDRNVVEYVFDMIEQLQDRVFELEEEIKDLQSEIKK